VVALGRQWLSDEPEQLLSHFKRQAEQLLALWRGSPPPAASDEHIEVVLVACPECGEALPIEEQRAVEQTILEVPVIQPRVVRLRTYRSQCQQCQQSVSSTHPLQVSQAIRPLQE
jgi:endogenous inhibitor of DNA gyrase (YacG/DUF329 family)